MGPGELLASFALLCGIIVVSLVVLTGYRHRLRVKERQLGLQAPGTPAPGLDIHHLEQRLRVLERIATDKGTQLTARIEALREKDPA